MPIVIRNAEVISARDSTTFNPGTVDVVVYPPIPTDDWTVQNLPDRIAEVRQLFLDTLKDWPHESVPKIGPYARAKRAARKTAAAPKKTAPRKTTARKATAKKVAAKKTTAKKTAARKATAKKGRS